jgi:hypothetical protein
MTAGAATKAAGLAGRFTTPIAVEPWAKSPARACQAAAAQVIGAQARLYEAAAAGEAVHLLLGLTAGLWTMPRIAPHPPLDALNALSRFGGSLPASAVDPLLELLEPPLAAGHPLIPEAANLLIQLYWAVPGRRADLAVIIGQQLTLDNPPPGLWGLLANLPAQARGPVTPAVSALADAGNLPAILTLATWGQPTPAVQLAARRTCAHLLRQQTTEPATTWSITTQFSDAAALLLALTAASTPTDVDPRELRPGTGPLLAGGTILTMTTGPASPPPDGTGTVPPDPAQDQAGVTPQQQPPQTAPGSDRPGYPLPGDAATATDNGPSWEPDPQALLAAGPPPTLAAAVADHLLAVAEGHHAPAFVRAQALDALDSLLRHLPPDVNSRLAGRLLTIAEHPSLNEHDQAELASQDPLSRGRIDMGAKGLPMQALVAAANAASSAAAAGTSPGSLPTHAVHSLVTHAVQLLHSPDREASKHGAVALALASRSQPSLATYTTALVIHPNDEVRAIAASTAALDEITQRILVADTSPQVRARLASRAPELAADILAALRADNHPDVVQALASSTAESGTKPTRTT